MGFQLSPGINITEIDLTTIVPAVGTTVGAIAGPFQWGPANKPMLLDSELTLHNTFGGPDNTTANVWFTAANFLAYASALQAVRVIKATGTGAHKNATADGSGLLIANEDAYLNNYANGQATVGMFAAKYAGILGNSLSVSIADQDSFATWIYRKDFDGAPNTSADVTNGGGANDEFHLVVIDSNGAWTGTPGDVLERFAFLSKSATAMTENGSTMYYPEVINRTSKYVWWMGHPLITDLGITGSVNWGGDNTVTYQTTSTKLTLTSVTGVFTPGETVQDTAALTIVPPGSGATAGTITFSTGAIATIPVTVGGTAYVVAPNVVITGNGTGAVAHATISGGVVTGVTIDTPGTGYTAATATFVVPGSGATASVTVGSHGNITAVAPVANGTGYTTPPIVTITGPGSGATVTAVLGTGGTSTQVVSYTVTAGGTGYLTKTAKVVSFATSVLTIQPTSGSFVGSEHLVGLTSHAIGVVSTIEGGALAFALTGGVDGNTVIQDGEIIIGYDNFKSSEDIDISLILNCDYDSTVAIDLINDIAEFRKDCVVFISPPKSAVVDNAGNEATDVIAFRNMLPSSSYAVMDSGWKYQYDKYNDLYRWVPLNGDVAGLCVRTDVERDPWWSPAGYNRGFIQNTVKLAWSPRLAFRDELYQNSVNSVITEKGQGTLLFGDKTLLSKPSAFDRINVRRLFIVLEKAIALASKFTLFEFNDQFTRAQFVNMVEPYLRDVKGRRGLYDFRVVCDETNNTPEVIDSNRFIGDIYLKPVRSINFIQLNFIAVRTGVAFTEVVGRF
jgi:phage tail sheath protein FI